MRSLPRPSARSSAGHPVRLIAAIVLLQISILILLVAAAVWVGGVEITSDNLPSPLEEYAR